MLASNKLICHKSIDFCKTYKTILEESDPVSCIECLPAYYLESTLCVILTVVENCSEYSKTQNSCIKCEDQHLLYENKCVGMPLLEFCKDFKYVESEFKCSNCIEGAYLHSDGNCYKRMYSLGLIPNCSALEDFFDKCKSCHEGFGLSASALKCLQKVKHCSEDYLVQQPSEFYKCVACLEPYSLDAQSNICFTQITGCLQYNSSFTKCVKCENSTYFLENEGTCSERSNKSTNCEEFNPSVDSCSSCRESFHLTSDQLSCLPSIDFCLVIYQICLIFRITTYLIKIRNF